MMDGKKQTLDFLHKVQPGTRIDVVGNANNYPLMVARGLRELGYDAHVHLTMRGQLNAPENRYAEYADGYPLWIHDWRALGEPLWFTREMQEAVEVESRAAQAFIYNYDAVFLGAEETRPSFCLLTGTDLLEFANPGKTERQLILQPGNLSYWANRRYIQRWIDFCLRQRAAIRQAEGYYFFPRGLLEPADRILESLGADPARQISFLLSETDQLNFRAPQRRDRLNLLLSARLTWDRSTQKKWTSQDYKGTDIVLRGFAKFLSAGGNAVLTICRKGEHVLETERLARELGITEQLEWHDELSQQDFLEAMKNADVVIDSIGDAHIGMAAVDAMSLGRPVIASAPAAGPWGWPEDIPICNARSADEVAAWLEKLASDFGFRTKLAREGRRFAEANFSPRNAAARILEKLARPAPKPEGALYRALSLCGVYDGEEDRLRAEADRPPPNPEDQAAPPPRPERLENTGALAYTSRLKSAIFRKLKALFSSGA